jgi:cell division protein FtsW (lipid II flippase)
MYSVSIYESFDVTRALEHPTNYFYFFQHLQKIVLGIIACSILRYIPRKTFKQFDLIFFLWAAILLWLLFSPLGDNDINTAQKARLRLTIPWFNLQPSEFYKIGYVLFLANWMHRKKNLFAEFPYFLGTIGMIAGLCLLFVFLPDFWTILVLWIVGMCMYRYSGGKSYYILVSILLWFGSVMIIEPHVKYIHDRIEFYLDPSKDKTGEGIGYQINNALTSVGAGGFLGRGYGKWLQKFWNLPEAQSDFIFAAFLEEIWFFWWSILLLLYVGLAYISIQWLSKIQDEHDALILVWCISLITIQAWINMGVNINLIPLTWLTLPFISHGWSALIVNCITVTIIAKILNTIDISLTQQSKRGHQKIAL